MFVKTHQKVIFVKIHLRIIASVNKNRGKVNGK